MTEKRRLVALMVADGMDADAIAAVMGLAVEKLRAIFAHELQHGTAIVRAGVLARLDAAGESGSVAANKALENIATPNAANKALENIATPSAAGKKAIAAVSAQKIADGGGMFAPPPAPPRGQTETVAWGELSKEKVN